MNLFTEYQRRSALRALREYQGHVLGVYEFAKVCGVQRNTFCNWMDRNKLPEPDTRLASGSLWTRQTVQNWLSKVAVDQ